VTGIAASGAASRLRWRALAALLAVVAAFCLVMWGASSDTASPAGASVDPSSSSTGAPPPASAAATEAAPPARPVTLSIPTIEVQTHVIRLGQHQDGTVEVPDDPAEAGWFQHGPPPGAGGSSVILGHFDSMSGPAVFHRLEELRPGDRIAVLLDDGTTVRFRVHSIETYANADFPARKVYGKQGRSQLNLVTCGGAYDASRGGYQSNVVVNARRTG
jgi:LPXTG-site transpeptidase (sortase) family protein